MLASLPPARAVGIDFGTTNSVIARSSGGGHAELVAFDGPDGASAVFRSALCFWQDEAVRGGLAHEAGPWAIAEFLDFPQGSRFLQSFKSVAASSTFEHANLFEKRLRFEELGQVFLKHMMAHGEDALRDLPERIVVGRPVRYVGSQPDPQLARKRYDAMFAPQESATNRPSETHGRSDWDAVRQWQAPRREYRQSAAGPARSSVQNRCG